MPYRLPVLPDVPDYPQSAISDCGASGECRHCKACCTYYLVKNVPSVLGDPDSERIDKLPGDTCPQAIVNTRGQLFCALHGDIGKPKACQAWIGNERGAHRPEKTNYENLTGVIAGQFIAPYRDGLVAQIGEDYRNGRLPPEVAAAIRNQCETAISIDPGVGRVYMTGMLQQLLTGDVPDPFPWTLLDAADLRSAIATVAGLPGAERWENELRNAGFDPENNPLHQEFRRRYGP